jgi:hypothetical protein
LKRRNLILNKNPGQFQFSLLILVISRFGPEVLAFAMLSWHNSPSFPGLPHLAALYTLYFYPVYSGAACLISCQQPFTHTIFYFMEYISFLALPKDNVAFLGFSVLGGLL